LAARGYSQADVADQARSRGLLDGYYILGTVSREVAQQGLDAAAEKPWFEKSYLPRYVESDPALSRWRTELGHDPIAPLEALKVPVLMLFGDSDGWIPVQRSLDLLAPILVSHRNITAHLVPNAAHAMGLPEHEGMEIDDTRGLQLAPESPDYFLMLGAWLGGLGYALRR
jgi:pimeloyl-ACP methyl ester carboxylesterase